MRKRGLAAILSFVLVALSVPAVAQQRESLAGLRSAALALVNRDRQAHGLAPLTPTAALNAAAQDHAEDMLRRTYFSHFSPEGRTVGDRYRAQGGSLWQFVAENIAACRGCSGHPSVTRIRIFEHGLMHSRYHRENILNPGITQFGFGIAGAGERIYAVQTFAGPGEPRGAGANAPAPALSSAAQAALALRLINAARRKDDLPPLALDAGLTATAHDLVSNNPQISIDLDRMSEVDALTDKAGPWRSVGVQSSRCGGCGLHPTAKDIAFFTAEMLRQGSGETDVLAPGLDAAGFAMTEDGHGMKSAVLLIGTRRRSASVMR